MAKNNVSLIIPVLDEQESIGELYTWIKKVLKTENLKGELIFIDDGSTDEIMGEIWIDLNDYTSNGTKTNKYPSTIQHSAQGCTVEFDLTWE